MTRICLNMIVKNEAARIERCLASVAPYISCYAITDTGSADGTPEIIQEYFRTRGIEGYINFTTFINFEQARNEALHNAKNIPSPIADRLAFDHLLLVDADMELVVETKANPFDYLTAAAYTMLQRSGTLSYWNTRLLRHDVHHARYVGVTHEFLSVPGPAPAQLYGAYFVDHQDGANRPGKLERDAALLEDDIREKARSFYYLGQSKKDMGKPTEAALAYKVRASMGGWSEEAWSALLNAARCETIPSDRVVGLIDAFNARPSRAEPLYDLARHYRERGMNDAAVLFADAALKIPKPDDILFVEDAAYSWGPKEEMSISGFYTASKARAHDLCEELALSRTAPQATRENAWRNLFHYTKPLAEQASSFRAQLIDFTPPDGYHPMNPSVCRVGDQMYMNVRAVNYVIGQDGRYVMPDDGVIRTRNFLAHLRHDLDVSTWSELKLPAGTPEVFTQCLGFEDIRLFLAGERILASATARQLNPQGHCEIVMSDLLCMGPRSWEHRIIRAIHPEGPRRQEKNWMPIVGDEPRWIYSCDPVRVVGDRGQTLFERPSPVASAEWGGSSQAIPWSYWPVGDLPRMVSVGRGYLALIHERQADIDPMYGQRNYQRRFVWFDSDFNIRRISRRFVFGHGRGEFVCGMCWHPDGKRLVISYGVLDREAWLATVDADEVRAMLQEVGDGNGDRAGLGVCDASNSGDRDRGSVEGGAPDRGDRAGGANPGDRGAEPVAPVRGGYFGGMSGLGDILGLGPPVATIDEDDAWGEDAQSPGAVTCAPVSDPWLDRNTNAALRTEADLNYAIDAVKANYWPVHPDHTKNWDCYIALRHVMKHASPGEPILDAGADRVSTFLPTLARLGYKDLTGVNLLETKMEHVGGITYKHGNIEGTGHPDGWFSFVACLSTIEHGVEVPKFLAEAARILKPGGHLFISTDYWREPIHTGITGWKIFSLADIMWLATGACIGHGLHLAKEASFETEDRVCHHGGCDYTFINLLFRKAS